nr:hypothetical protein [Kallipyga gabonensis]
MGAYQVGKRICTPGNEKNKKEVGLSFFRKEVDKTKEKADVNTGKKNLCQILKGIMGTKNGQNEKDEDSQGPDSQIKGKVGQEGGKIGKKIQGLPPNMVGGSPVRIQGMVDFFQANQGDDLSSQKKKQPAFGKDDE